MYIPSSFKVEERDTLYEFMEKNSFAILFSQMDGEAFATHLPFLLDKKEGCLYGHMARDNPHWKKIDHEVLVVFIGAHSYISPSWYETHQAAVPTWNYVAVHVYGELKIIEDRNELKKILNDSVNFYESAMPNPWDMNNVDASFIDNLSNGIVGFKIKITRMEGKWKLSQNHSKERQERVVNALETKGDANSQQISKLMRENIQKAAV
jgi:transcriptional regulator